MRDYCKITMIEFPEEKDWQAVMERALVTVGKRTKKSPTREWREGILEARHSPIRRLRFSFFLEGVPYWLSVHLSRHTHAQPYIQSQRDEENSRNERLQDHPVNMIWDLNGEELMIVANKRLCKKAHEDTRGIVKMMCTIAAFECPEFERFLVPMCVYHGGTCHEMKPCGKVEEK